MFFVALASPLELWNQGEQYELGSVKQRCVLSVLLHASGEPVASDTLIERVWGDDPPLKPLESLHTYVSRLRTLLWKAVGEEVALKTASRGRYQLIVDSDAVDLRLLQRLRADAAAAAARGDREVAIGLLDTAESLWHGEPFAEFTCDWALSVRGRLDEDLRRIREERIRLGLELGRHADLVGELHEMATQHPLAEQVTGLLMTALYRSGRVDDALSAYRSIDRRLRESQGVAPGTELQELQRRILAQDETLRTLPEHAAAPRRTDPAATARAAPGPAGYNNLPRDVQGFTGRTGELELLLGEPREGERTLPLTVVHGMPGVGKTALAVRAAHRLADRYPDGALYVDLRGYSAQPPCEPAEALALLLRVVGASADEQQGESLDTLVCRWREWTARHKALLVLDNASAPEQVRPLLPGNADCRAIVTSRNCLTALEGASPLFLDVLPTADAVELFTRVVGEVRVPDEAALQRAVRVYRGHTLSIQLLAASFRRRESWDLHHLAARVTGSADLLGELGGEVVGSAFRLSYDSLSEPVRRLFRSLSVHPGPDLTPGAAAVLAGEQAHRTGPGVRRGLDVLLDRHLVEEPVCERYTLHDLTRAFGRQVCRTEESAAERTATLRRLLAYYLTSADRADRLAHPRRRRFGLTTAQLCDGAEAFADAAEAAGWLTAERANLLAVARASAAEAPAFAGPFTHVLALCLREWGAWSDYTELHAAAETAVRDLGDRFELAQIQVERAEALGQEGPAEALRCATEARALFEDLDDVPGVAAAQLQIGRAELAAGRPAQALPVLNEALVLHRSLRDRAGEAETLNVTAVALHYTGDNAEALRRFGEVLEFYKAVGDRRGVGTGLNNMGEILLLEGETEGARHRFEAARSYLEQVNAYREIALVESNLGAVHQRDGDSEQALVCYHRALSGYRKVGDSSGQADALISIGTVHAAASRQEAALSHYGKAEEIARRIGNEYERQRALTGTADVHRAAGRTEAALRMYEKALGMARSVGFAMGAAQALDGMVRALIANGETAKARRIGEEAVAAYQRLEASQCADGLRRILAGEGATDSDDIGHGAGLPAGGN